MAKKWLDSIEKQKRRSNVCERQMNRWTDRVNDKNNRLGAEINNCNSQNNVYGAVFMAPGLFDKCRTALSGGGQSLDQAILLGPLDP